jgi:hypothetical protein
VVDLTAATIPYWELRAKSSVATGIEQPFLTAYREGSFHYLLIAADRGCPVEEAVEATVELHNKIVHEFEDGHRDLMAVPSPELQRFLVGVRSWMGGGFTWHATNPRYR